MSASARPVEELDKWLNAQHQEKAIAHLARLLDAQPAVAVGVARAVTGRILLRRTRIHPSRRRGVAGSAEAVAAAPAGV